MAYDILVYRTDLLVFAAVCERVGVWVRVQLDGGKRAASPGKVEYQLFLRRGSHTSGRAVHSFLGAA